jgi:hypothetical protein
VLFSIFPSEPIPTVTAMPQWIILLIVAIGAWLLLSVGGGLLIGRILSVASRRRPHTRRHVVLTYGKRGAKSADSTPAPISRPAPMSRNS